MRDHGGGRRRTYVVGLRTAPSAGAVLNVALQWWTEVDRPIDRGGGGGGAQFSPPLSR